MATDERYGFLFPKKDRTSDRHPNMTGKLNVPDVGEIEIAAWTRTAKSGVKYLSLRISNDPPSNTDAPAEPVQETLDEDIPF